MRQSVSGDSLSSVPVCEGDGEGVQRGLPAHRPPWHWPSCWPRTPSQHRSPRRHRVRHRQPDEPTAGHWAYAAICKELGMPLRFPGPGPPTRRSTRPPTPNCWLAQPPGPGPQNRRATRFSTLPPGTNSAGPKCGRGSPSGTAWSPAPSNSWSAGAFETSFSTTSRTTSPPPSRSAKPALPTP